MKSELARWLSGAGWALLMLFGSGCSEKPDLIFRDNLPPEVRLTAAPIGTQDPPSHYSYRMSWVGFDPDGRVDHFLIAVDPLRPDTVDVAERTADSRPMWQKTTNNEETIRFRASSPDSIRLGISTDHHVFAVAAVDQQGRISRPVYRAFFSFTQAPRVVIESPRPNPTFTPITTPTVRIRWRGTDPDGQSTTRPVKYKFRLFAKQNPDFPAYLDFVSHVLSNPRFLYWTYAPTFGPSEKCPTCTAWESSSAETTEKQYFNLIPGQIYLFAVTGFDEAGAYDPVFSTSSNLFKFAVTFAGTLGPQICMGNEYFNYCYVTGGYANDPTRYFNIEVPADQPVTFNWIAFPPPGADMRRYRWVLDLEDLTDETPRENEQTDLSHWSQYGLLNMSATIGPFRNAPEDHLFFIEAEDNNGLRSLGIIRFTVVRATLEKDVLFVDDTRLSPDHRGMGGTIDPPRGPWPSAAELDTFFFARGGFPWRGPYPPGTQSVPGIFHAWGPFGSAAAGAPPSPYSRDTLGTRGIVSGLAPLAVLGRYKLVVWYTDDVGATYRSEPINLLDPITSLRLMSQPGQPSTISTYLKQGGKVWMMGGGAAYATLAFWGKPNTPVDDWTNNDLELIPGRFMYDFAKWQSSVGIRPAQQAILNSPSFFPGAAVGRGWSAHGMNRDLIQPDYSKLTNDPLMEILYPRSCATDPPPPLRTCNSFYLSQYYPAEFIGRSPSVGGRAPNFIREDADPDPDVFREESTLDTLYLCLGGTAPPAAPIMTYYHGFQTPQLVFMGAPLWFFQKAQVMKLTDFVMTDIFGVPKVSAAPPMALRPMRSPVASASPGAKKVAVPLRR
jgi:hypothetical protein